ncbi:MAG: hypothetical protein A3I39_01240 [Candidatus Yanofskybacteria bacterium RIFCSPLOWO2_02_FULL_47_9b]|uniref:Uncharacterized protein n=1 Tax=Candidatus Yanofskybacteria bacterium RIFCSPLOWO2_02_FULL_47_9b TaxID=1802708 RepID=A0A1F8H7P2_9BACT|nr:MAG: hypothetical protein A3I39_01240 [Candidatus Yanofskybacteria bacterium RIFCSPLOWO2_02_FULL_47_9b]
MELIIHFKTGREVELRLCQSGQTIDQLIIGVDFSFDKVLVTSIDKIIKRNRIEKSSLNTVKVSSEEDLSSVAFRVAQAVAEAIKSQ